jgi:hypothetical protein
MPYNIVWMDDSHANTEPIAGEVIYAETGWGHAGEAIDVIIYPEFVVELESDETRERIILHELLHPILNSVDEFTVNKATELLWKAYEQ